MKINFRRLFFLLLISILIAGCSSKFEKEQRKTQQKITQETAVAVQAQIDSILKIIVENLKNSEDINSTNLLKLQLKFAAVSAIILYNLDSKIEKIVPQNFDAPKNKIIFDKKNPRNISLQISEFQNGKYFTLQIPIFDENKNLSSIISVFILSENFFKVIEQEYCFPLPYSLLITNQKGKIIYDKNIEKIGKNFIESENPKQHSTLKNLYIKMLENNASYEIFSFPIHGKKLITKQFTWNTINILKTKLWICLIRNLNNKPSKDNNVTYLLSSLRGYSIRDTLIDTIIEKDWEKTEDILKEIYQLNSEIYSVQLADKSGKIVSGLPSGNSIIGYSFKMQKNPEFDSAMKKVLSNGTEKFLVTSLLEGSYGKFSIVPIKFQEEIIGALFSIEEAKKE